MFEQEFGQGGARSPLGSKGCPEILEPAQSAEHTIVQNVARRAVRAFSSESLPDLIQDGGRFALRKMRQNKKPEARC